MTKPVAWPSPGSSTVDLPVSGAAGSAVIGGLPIRVSPVSIATGDLPSSARASQPATPSRVGVEVLSRASSSRIGATAAVRVWRADGLTGPARVRLDVDYSGFRDAFGADWSWRLRLVAVPSCALAGVVSEACGRYTDLGAVNDGRRGVLSAEVDLSSSAPDGAVGGTVSKRRLGADGSPPSAAGPQVVGIIAAAGSTEAGDFTRTDLKESSSWAAGLQSGDFTWSYPMGVPPVPGGLVPDVRLSYSSGAVDGQTAGRHTQPGVVGEGWSLSQSFVERTYRPCSDDTANSPYWPVLNTTADLCWRLPNAQVMLGGRVSEIVAGDDGVWRLADGNGEKVELLAGAPNDDDNGEHWKITTTDGTQYWFGKERLPNGRTGTNAVMSAPVFANHAGEPCFSTASALSSRCNWQGVRWMLDYVVDRNGNDISLWYGQAQNLTAVGSNSSNTYPYIRDVYLSSIEYGSHTTDAATVTPPVRVSFDYADRCLTASCGTHNAANWPDTPWDLQCNAAPCGNNTSPSFWTDRRLYQISVQTSGRSSWQTLDAWRLTHEFPGTGDGSHPVLWLSSITRTGYGTANQIALPPTLFYGTRSQNRADYDPNGTMRSHNKWRISTIVTETAHQVQVTYSGDDTGCRFGGAFPNPDNNPRRCFPQYYVPETAPPGWSWWHRRVITSVVESDATGAPPITHEYFYTTLSSSTAVLWAHDDGSRVWGSSVEFRSWADWRGYSNVSILTGPPGGLRSRTDHVYFRGLDGDRTDVGPRSVTLSLFNGGAWSDSPQRRGHLANTYVFASAAESYDQVEQHDPWTQVTGTRTLSSTWAIPSTFTSHINRTGATNRWVRVDDGTMSWRTGVDTVFDSLGRVFSQSDKGNAASGDETCTRVTYADNAVKHLYAFPVREQTVNRSCPENYSVPQSLVSDHAYRYDGGGEGAAPTVGNVTRDSMYVNTGWVDLATNIGHDKFGRVTSSEDGLGRRTTTAYNPISASSGLGKTVLVTNPLGHGVSSRTNDRGQPIEVTDANGKTTTGTYDALGRLLTVTRPGNTTGTPNVQYDYSLSQAGPTNVRTRVLGPTGNQITSYEFFDGLLRPRQTQTTAPDGKRVITDIQYDQRGLAVKSSSFYNAASGPTWTLVTFNDADVDQQIRATFDGRGRQVTSQLWSRNNHRWQTNTVYGWNRTSVIPPTGGTTTQDMHDDRGRLIEKRLFASTNLAGAYDATRYGYSLRDELTLVSDPAGNTWTYEYDLLGRQTRAVDPDTGTSTKAYDNASQLVSSTDGRGISLFYTYDALGRETALRQGSSNGPMRAAWTYDTVAKGQLSTTERHDGGLVYTNAVLGYDAGYRPTSTRLTVPSSTANGALAGSYTFGATYKVNGSVATTTLPAAGDLPAETLTYGYIDAGLPTTLSGASSYVASTTYHFDGQPAERILGATGKRIRQTYGVEASTRRLETIQLDTENPSTPGAWVDRFTTEYAYDQAGNVWAVAGKTDGVRDQVECLRYDNLRRLTEAWTNSFWDCGTPTRTGVDPYRRSWTYNRTGNRLTQVDHGAGGTTTTTYSHPAGGAVQPHGVTQAVRAGAQTGTDHYSYDSTGNMIGRSLAGQSGQTLTWDAEGRLAQITVNGQSTTYSYLYDADGKRLLARNPGGTTLYLPDGTELTSSGAGGPVQATRHYASIAIRDSGGLRWVATDNHGTGTAQIDATTLSATRRRTMPFGEPRGSEPAGWSGTKGFVGGTIDPTGLTHLGAREYDPATGRFISVDPVIDPGDPQQMHGYAYANNSPVTLSDPHGLSPLPGGGPPIGCADDPCDHTDVPSHGPISNPPKPAPPQPGGSSTVGNKNAEDRQKLAKEAFLATFTDDHPVCQAFSVCKTIRDQVAADRMDPDQGAIEILCGGTPSCIQRFYAGGGSLESFLTVVGFVPIVGEGADGLSMVIAINKGDWRGAALSAAAMLPLVGNAAAVKRLSLLKGLCSFSGDTQVLMADGTAKPIEDIEVGDMVLATDPETGEQGPREVTHLWIHDDQLVDLDLAGVDAVTTTEDHPFWNATDQQWQQAQQLDPGDLLLTSTGAGVPIVGIDWDTVVRGSAYNLTVADIHTYYVLAGKTPVLVHNAGCTNLADLPNTATRNLTTDADFAFERLNLNHRVTREEFRTQIHEIKRVEGLSGDFDLMFGPTGDIWNPVSGELIGHIVHGG